MLLDLVSPWCAAIERSDPTRATLTFRRRHAAVLDPIRRHRIPLDDALPLETDPAIVRSLRDRAADPAFQQLIRDTATQLAAHGATPGRQLVLLAGDGSGEPFETIPAPHDLAALFLERISDEPALIMALARAGARSARWSAMAGAREWNRWEMVRQLRLREWIYLEGMALHLAAVVAPALPIELLLGVNRAMLGRLRQRERGLRDLLARDLDHGGVGTVLRWLTADAPAAARTIDGIALPLAAGSYLAWRMVAERVERVGIAEAMHLPA